MITFYTNWSKEEANFVPTPPGKQRLAEDACGEMTAAKSRQLGGSWS